MSLRALFPQFSMYCALASCCLVSGGGVTVSAAEGGAAPAEIQQQIGQLEAKIAPLEQFLQKLRQERMSRPRDMMAQMGQMHCHNFDELGEMWDGMMQGMGGMGDCGAFDDDLFLSVPEEGSDGTE